VDVALLHNFAPVFAVDTRGVNWWLATGDAISLLFGLLRSHIKNFFGGQIYKEQGKYGQGNKPDSQMFFSGVNSVTQKATEWINDMTGGTDIVSGGVDINPETIDHFVTAYTGGIGKFVFNTIGTTATIINKEVPNPRNVPILRQFVKYPSEHKAKILAYNLLAESSRTLFDKRMEERFYRNLDYAAEHEQITQIQANEIEKEFTARQKEAQRSLDEKAERKSNRLQDLPVR